MINFKGIRKELEDLKNSKKKSKEERLHLLIFLFVFVLVFWIIAWLLINHFIESENNRGLFGDQFGSINALFSGFALAGIIYTILLQKKELALQREELEETREEFKIQNVTLKKQRFENTFFHLLALHNDIVNNLKIEVFDGSYENRRFFEGAIKQLKFKSPNFEYYKYSFLVKLKESEISAFLSEKNMEHQFIKKLDDDEKREINKLSKEEFENYKQLTNAEKEEFIKNDYLSFFNTFQDSLGHYFRNLYHIFKYVYLTDLIFKNEKMIYSNIVRAQLSSDELVLLFYNSITPVNFSSNKPTLGYPKFKFLIQEFDILQNMNKMLLLDISHFEIFKNNNVTENPFTYEIS